MLTVRKNPLIVYAGQNISEDYMTELRHVLNTRNWGIVVISKSGTTTEPALAFRLLKTDIEKKEQIDEMRKEFPQGTDKQLRKEVLKQINTTKRNIKNFWI